MSRVILPFYELAQHVEPANIRQQQKVPIERKALDDFQAGCRCGFANVIAIERDAAMRFDNVAEHHTRFTYAFVRVVEEIDVERQFAAHQRDLPMGEACKRGVIEGIEHEQSVWP